MKLSLVAVALLLSSFAQAYDFDNSVPKDIKNQMLADLDFVQTIQGGTASALHNTIFGDVDGKGYINFFQTRIQRIGLSDCGNPNAVACVSPFFDPHKMFITQNFIKFSHPQIARLMVVFHESRHSESENGNWMHADCPTPFLDADAKDMKSIWTGAQPEGQPACDVTPFGSYGSSMIMLKNIQKFCKNCTDKVKSDAGMYADDQYKRVTDAQASDEIKKDLYSGRRSPASVSLR